MKQYYLKSIFLLLFISIFIILIGFFLSNNKQNSKKAIFNIYYKKQIHLGENFGLIGRTNNYNKIDYIGTVGKGFFVNKSEFITAKHLFQDHNTNNYFIKINNKNYNFKIIKNFYKQDLVLGKILKYDSKDFITIKNIGDNLFKNQKIFVYKNNKKEYGKIINTNTNISEINLYNLIKTNIKLYPGDSGTPMFNYNNDIIGIYILIQNNSNISYAQKISL